MKKLNLSLAAGGVIIGILILIMLFPQKFTSFNPYVIEGIKSSVQKNGTLAIQGAPFSPSKLNILGTDQLGRDLLSLIIYGTRLTLELGLLTVAGRFIIAIPMGIAAGFGNSFSKSVINLFNVLFSAIPALIISVLILNISFFKGLYKEQSIIAFAVVLTITGFGRLARLIGERTENILSQPFIKGEKAIGKRKIKIAFENVLSHLTPELIVLFFIEMALALSMIMELGFFGVYVGNLRVVADTDGIIQMMNISYEPEWASMLASSMKYISIAPWTVLSPAVTFFISIFGFNLFGEGLREELQKKNSGFSLRLRKFRKSAVKKAAMVLSLILVVFMSFNIVNYSISYAETKKAESIVNWQFKNSVLLGSEEAEYTADKIKASLKEAGFQPIGNDYIHSYNVDKLYTINNYKFNVLNGNNKLNLIWGRDFSLSSNINFKSECEIIDGRNTDVFKIQNYKVFDNKLILLDEDTYSRDSIENLNKKIKSQSKCAGVIDVLKSDDKLPDILNEGNDINPVIYLSKEASKKIKSDSKIEINIENRNLTGTGRNIIGILPGKSKTLSKEAIMISMGYNYLDYDKENISKKIEMMIETAKKLYDKENKQGRSIIIAFYDGNLTDNYAGVKNFTEKPVYPLENILVNIDLTGLNINNSSIVLNTQQVPITKYFAWAFSHQLELNINHKGIKVSKYTSKKTVQQILDAGPDSQEILYYKGAVPTVLTIYEAGNDKNSKLYRKFSDILVSSITNINY